MGTDVKPRVPFVVAADESEYVDGLPWGGLFDSATWHRAWADVDIGATFPIIVLHMAVPLLLHAAFYHSAQ